jgi:hypothetical protein
MLYGIRKLQQIGPWRKILILPRHFEKLLATERTEDTENMPNFPALSVYSVANFRSVALS